jgi:hypothetical protein
VFAVAAILSVLAAVPAAQAAARGIRDTAGPLRPGRDLASSLFDAGLSGVSAVSPTDAWGAGSYYDTTTGTQDTLIQYWNGTSWSQVASPNPSPSGGFNGLNSVSADSSSDAWAVGSYCASGCNTSAEVDSTLTLHWTGTAWAQVPSPNPGGSAASPVLYSVSADSPTDVWAVGQYQTATAYKTLILHWNGTGWSRVKSPNPGPSLGGMDTLASVSADSPTDAWAVGQYCTTSSCAVQDSLIVHWNGASWAKVKSPNPGSAGFNRLNGVSANSPTDAWAAGIEATTTGTVTLIVHWNGTSWVKVKSPNPGPGTSPNDQLNGVSADLPTDAWAVGTYCASGCGGNSEIDDTLTLHWNGTSWARVKSPNQSMAVANFLGTVSADSPADAWAAGDYCTAEKCTVHSMLLLHWNGTAWSQS